MEKISEQLKNNSASLLVLLLVVGAFYIGKLSTEVKVLKTAAPAAVQQPSGGTAPSKPAVSLDTIKGLFKKDLVKFGDAGKKVIFVEVSDPSCPFCHAASGLNPTLSKQMGAQFVLTNDGGTYKAPGIEMKKLLDQGKIGYIWMYSNGHGNGELAAKALYCANEKGKFWDAHSLLFSSAGYEMINTTVKNDITKSQTMADFLAKAVDSKFMNDCLSKDKYKERIAADVAVATSIGVQGTPGFFVNDVNFPGAVSFTEMEAAVNAGLK